MGAALLSTNRPWIVNNERQCRLLKWWALTGGESKRLHLGSVRLIQFFSLQVSTFSSEPRIVYRHWFLSATTRDRERKRSEINNLATKAGPADRISRAAPEVENCAAAGQQKETESQNFRGSSLSQFDLLRSPPSFYTIRHVIFPKGISYGLVAGPHWFSSTSSLSLSLVFLTTTLIFTVNPREKQFLPTHESDNSICVATTPSLFFPAGRRSVWSPPLFVSIDFKTNFPDRLYFLTCYRPWDIF